LAAERRSNFVAQNNNKPKGKMPIENTTSEAEYKRLLKQITSIDLDCEGQRDKWKNQVAQDLMTVLSRALYHLEQHGDESDVFAAKAVLRIAKRVEEFEGIRRAGK
jgi:hypothetical protein